MLINAHNVSALISFVCQAYYCRFCCRRRHPCTFQPFHCTHKASLRMRRINWMHVILQSLSFHHFASNQLQLLCVHSQNTANSHQQCDRFILVNISLTSDEFKYNSTLWAGLLVIVILVEIVLNVFRPHRNRRHYACCSLLILFSCLQSFIITIIILKLACGEILNFRHYCVFAHFISIQCIWLALAHHIAFFHLSAQ